MVLGTRTCMCWPFTCAHRERFLYTAVWQREKPSAAGSSARRVAPLARQPGRDGHFNAQGLVWFRPSLNDPLLPQHD